MYMVVVVVAVQKELVAMEIYTRLVMENTVLD
jgi:hypothetical protein